MSELRECPFCGRDEATVECEGEIAKTYVVACGHCEATGPWWASRKQAVASWNTRATPPRAEVDVESVVRSVRATLAAWTHPGMSEHDRSVCVEQAIRRALARDAGGA